MIWPIIMFGGLVSRRQSAFKMFALNPNAVAGFDDAGRVDE